MLETEDIQHILLARTPALTGRYEFLTFRSAAGGRAWLTAMIEKVQSVAAVKTSIASDKRWVTVAFTWNGLRALGVDEASLSTFPEEFRQGMAARAEVLGDTGANAPANWVGGLASPDLHAIVILFARDAAERERSLAEHEKLLAKCEGVETALLARPRGHAALRVRPRPLRLPRPAVTAGHRRDGRDADARHRRGAQTGRVHPRLPRRGRTCSQSAAARGPFPQRQLHGLPLHAGARRRLSRLPAAERQRRPRSRSSSRRS